MISLILTASSFKKLIKGINDFKYPFVLIILIFLINAIERCSIVSLSSLSTKCNPVLISLKIFSIGISIDLSIECNWDNTLLIHFHLLNTTQLNVLFFAFILKR